MTTHRRWLIALVAIPLALIALPFLPLSRVNAVTDDILAGATSVTVDLGSYRQNPKEPGTLDRYRITITDRALIDELRLASATRGESLLLGEHCACSGYPVIRTPDGRSISYHHEKSLRVPRNSFNYALVDPPRFARWLKSAGLPLDREMMALAHPDLFTVPRP